jgi:hypothetical protein
MPLISVSDCDGEHNFPLLQVVGCTWVIPNDYVQRRAVSRRGEPPSKPTNKEK